MAGHRIPKDRNSCSAGDCGQVDMAGEYRPGPGWVIGLKGYWQTEIGAEAELLRGPNAQMSDAPIPGNMDHCEGVCTAVTSAYLFATGDDVSTNTEKVGETLSKHKNPGVAAAGHILKHFVVAIKVYNVATQMDEIKQACSDLCGLSPFEYQLQYGFNQ